MPPIQSTSVRSRQVSTELRKLREQAGMTGAEVAHLLGMSPSKISRLETGHRGLESEDVAALLGLYRVPERRRNTILELVRKSDEQGWWQSQRSGLPDWRAFLDFEARATRIQNYELALVPGLLQTAEYATAVIRGINPTMTDAELNGLVRSRMARRGLLRRQDVQYLSVLDESVLHRVVPLRAGVHPGLRGPFLLLEFSGEPSIVFVENHGVTLYLEEKDDLASYRTALSTILAEALGTTDSLELIADLSCKP
ncbi:Helix-turn-helix domain-containing protein [Amycolatopsis marina]|uniref:Helix-turn-helix domain-containing protein n=1 Tax=Amycolatopsis marina TaxID=490629 RepID=A0A1I0VHC9_9PSEU|nr:helix-turn-helix transcriptional regulator [Amycolatopsis marina]SFA75340.1 Helix-turn-helix domain-containing protein [Amycolatopsis marina]